MKLKSKDLIIVLLTLEIAALICYQFDYFIDRYKLHFNDFKDQYKLLQYLTLFTILIVFIDLFKRFWYVTIITVLICLSLISCNKKAMYNKSVVWSIDSLEIPEEHLYNEYE